MLVDSHCHLDFPDYEDDIDEVVARARRAGVGVIQTISTRMTTFAKVLAVAERYDDMYCSVGVHPHNAGDEGHVTCAELVAAADHAKVIGIGEMNDQRMTRWTPFDREDPINGSRIRRIGCQPVDRFGGNGDETSGAKYLGGTTDVGREERHGSDRVEELECGVEEAERLRRGKVVDIAQRLALALRKPRRQLVSRMDEVLVADHDEYRAGDCGAQRRIKLAG